MSTSQEAEARLRTLVQANYPENRASWARKWKKNGGLVVGVLCTYVPVELLVAAGIMPWRVSGTWSERIDDALVMRSANSCGFCNHVLQSLLDGELNFLDGVVATTWEQDITRLWDVWHHLGKTKFDHILHLPHLSSPTAVKYYGEEIADFVKAVEKFVGKKITRAALKHAVEVCNFRRSLILHLYSLRQREVPPLSGAEMLGLTVAGTLMPVEQFNLELQGLMPYLESRKAPISSVSHRVLVSSDFADNPAYVEAIESAGCIVAMDDFDTGSRYYWGQVETNSADLPAALAQRYLGHPGSPRMFDWDAQADAVVHWVKEYQIHGVIELVQRYSRAREMRRPFFLEQMKKAGIMAISLEREYQLTNVGQLRNRAQALLEMLQPSV